MESLEITIAIGDMSFKYVRNPDDPFKWTIHTLHNGIWIAHASVDTTGADVLYEVSRHTTVINL